MDMPIHNLFAIYSTQHNIEFSSQILQKLAHCVGGSVHSYEFMRALVSRV